jgi:hypothetical protein
MWPMSYYANQFPYVILYYRKDRHAPGDNPFNFMCWAESDAHAAAQVYAAAPNASVCQITQTDNVTDAYHDFMIACANR